MPDTRRPPHAELTVPLHADPTAAPPEVAPPPGTGPTLPRREFLRRLAAAGAGGVALAVASHARSAGPANGPAASAVGFPDGVKAGDPRPGQAVIWTRVAPPPDRAAVPLTWSVAEDAAMERVVRGGITWARDAGAHTAKVLVRGLAPDRWYHYRFEGAGGASAVGRLRTAPRPGAAPDRLRYAYSSCQQRNDSRYVAHRAIAAEPIDFFLHLGDYVYVSDGGTITLDDYRGVYRVFHQNALLQALQATVPLVAVWDDGEFYNGVDRTGPPERLAAARTAWFEHMPVLRDRHDRTHRSVRWGRLAELFLLDTRQFRDPEVPENTSLGGLIGGQDSALPPGEQMFAPGRTVLGPRQTQWFRREIRRTAAAWRLVGSSFNVNPWKLIDRDTPALRAQNPALQRNGGVYVSNEGWDDFQAERRELLEYFVRAGIDNVVFNSGHTHIYLASDLQPDFDDPASPIAAVDFTSGSLTADPDPRTIAPEPVLHAAEQLMLEANAPYLRHVDLLNQGYVLVDLTPEEMLVDFRVIDTFDPDATARTAVRFRVVSGRPGMEVLPVPAP